MLWLLHSKQVPYVPTSLRFYRWEKSVPPLVFWDFYFYASLAARLSVKLMQSGSVLLMPVYNYLYLCPSHFVGFLFCIKYVNMFL